MPDDRDYKVGYGKPPAHTRFKPGQSGNRKGRPKNVAQQKKLFDLIEERLAQPIDLTLRGRKVRMPAKKAIALQIVNLAVKGDFKAIQLLDKADDRARLRHGEQIRLDPRGHDDDPAESDAAVIERFLRRQECPSQDDEDGNGETVQ